MLRSLGALVLWVAACHTLPGLPPPSAPSTPPRARMLAPFEPAQQVEYGALSTAAGGISVRDVRPQGPGDGAGIRLRLDRVVVDPEAPPADVRLVLERSTGDARGFVEVPTKSVWTRGDTLEATPQVELPEASEYRVRLAGRIEKDGRVLGDVQWRFETTRPYVAIDEPYGELGRRSAVLVRPSLPITPAELAAHLVVRAEPRVAAREDDEAEAAPMDVPSTGPRVAVRVRPARATDLEYGEVPPHALAIEPSTRWPADRTLVVRVDERVRSTVGPLPPPLATQARFDVRPDFAIGGLACPERSGTRCPLGAIAIATSVAVPDEELARIRIEPPLPGLRIATDYDEDGREQVIVDGEWVPLRRYDVVFPARLRDEHGRRLGRTTRVRVRPTDVPARGEAGIALSASRGIFEKPADARIGILGARLEEVSVRVTTVRAAAAVELVLARDLAAIEWPKSDRDVTIVRRPSTPRGLERGAITIELGEYAGPGDVVLVEARAEKLAHRTTGEPPKPVRGLFQISALGVVAHAAPRAGFARVTAMQTGAPTPDATVTLVRAGVRAGRGTTDAHGLAPLGAVARDDATTAILVDAGDDAVVLELRPHPWLDERRLRAGKVSRSGRLAITPRSSAGDRPELPPELRAGELPAIAIYSGRGLYMPGDAIEIAGWAGISTPHESLANRSVPARTPVTLELRRDADVVARVESEVDEHGRFVARMRVPTSAALGEYTVVAQLLGGSASLWLSVAEPRIPAFELLASPKADEVVRGTAMAIDVAARYLGGAAAPMESAHAAVSCWSTGAPPMRELPDGFSVSSSRAPSVWTQFPVLAPRGESELTFEVSTSVLDHRRPSACSFEIAAADRRLQELGTQTSVLVHPARLYLALGVSPPTYAGAARDVEVIAVTRTGRRAALADVAITLAEIEQVDGTRVELAPLFRCRRDLDAEGKPARCRTPKLARGEYRVRATASVEGAPIEIEHELIVQNPPPKGEAPTLERAAMGERRPWGAELGSAAPVITREPIRFEVRAPDRIHPGVPTRVTIRGPWSRAHGVLAVEHVGLRETIPFELEDGEARVLVTAQPGRGPTVELTARVARPREDGERARELTASAEIDISESFDLQVDVETAEHARPGEQVGIAVKVTDVEGTPVDARVALWVIDDGLHQLRRPWFPHFEHSFHPDRRAERSITRSYDALLEPFSPWLTRRSSRVPAVRMAQGNVAGAGEPPLLRRFDPAPLFVGNVGTGPDGTLEVPFVLPDDLTRFRITAVVSASLPDAPESGPVRFGRGEATIALRTPLEVRAALPRVMRPGDRASIGALVTTPRAGRLELELELPDRGLVARAPLRRVVELKRGGTTRVDFEVDAKQVGAPRVRMRAKLVAGGKTSSAGVEQRLPIELERTAVEIAARYGSVDGDEPIAVPVRIPTRAVAGHGEVRITSNATLLGELEDAATYLSDYPYGCLEQSTSRLMPLVAMGMLSGRNGGKAEIATEVGELVAHIAAMQLDDGELGYWPGAREPATFVGAYALWVLQLAAERGVAVPERMLTRLRAALAGRVRAELSGTDPRRELEARPMILHALAVGGDATAADFDATFRARGSLSAFGRIMLALALHRAAPQDARMAELRRELDALVEERAGVAHVAEPAAREAEWFDSGARDDAAALMALTAIVPDDPRVEKLARGLRDRREAGRWRTTQENAFALLALAEYAAAREPEVPAHRIRAWIGPRAVLDAEVAGFDRVSRGGSVDLDAALRSAGRGRTTEVVLQREGRGRAFYRIGVEWAEADPPARAQGLALERRILDEHGSPVTELVAGRRYLLELTIDTPAMQHWLAVDAPLPAGLEAIDLSLGNAARARAPLGVRSSEVSHVELRRDRALVFFDELPAGEHVHTIPVLATTAGSWTLPGAVAEAMYEPETRARTTGSRIEIRTAE